MITVVSNIYIAGIWFTFGAALGSTHHRAKANRMRWLFGSLLLALFWPITLVIAIALSVQSPEKYM